MTDPDAAVRPVVLVVENVPLLRLNAVDLVERAGFEAVEAGSVDAAIRILEDRLDIRIVFTDIDMPRGLDGMRLAATIRDRWPPIEIVLTSSSFMPPEAEMPARSVFIPKPYAPEHLVAALHRFVA